MKSEVAYLFDSETVKEAMDKFSRHGYTAVPVINAAGEYLSTVTEGDFLRYILENDVTTDMACMNTDKLCDISIKRDIHPVHVTESIDSLIELCKTQNFVPVVDDRGMFIGIVTRKDLLCYSISRYEDIKKQLAERV